MYRCDVFNPATHQTTTTWHTSKTAAEVTEWRLRFNGARHVVSWFDAAVYEGAA